jgi:hypothetical protein
MLSLRFLFISTVVQSITFTPGNVVVLQLGSSTLPFTTAVTNNQVVSGSLLEYSPSGSLIQTISLGKDFSFSTADSFGAQLSRSENDRYLFVSGFDAVEGTRNVDATFANNTARVVAKVKFDGTVDSSTKIKSSFDGGVIRCIASDDGDDVYLFGTDVVHGDRVVIVNTSAPSYSQYDTIFCVSGSFRGCDIHDDRLFGTGEDGYVYAIEDLHSFEPGLPDAVFDPAFPPTSRKVSPQSDPSIGGIQFTGAFPDTIAWVGSQTQCMNRFTFIDNTPTSYVKDFGYLDAGNDLLDGETKNLNYNGATTLCDSIPICAGFTFFWNASFYSPPRPWTPDTVVSMYLKGPFFYFTQMDETQPETWWTYQKPQTSGNFNLARSGSVTPPCVESQQTGIFNLADNEDESTGKVLLYFTTTDGTKLYSYDTTAQITRLIATAPTNTVFRGVAMAPFYGYIPPAPAKNKSDLTAGNYTEEIVIPLVIVILLGAIVWIYEKERVLKVVNYIGTFFVSGGSTSSRFPGGETTSLLGPKVLTPEEAKRRTSPIKV